MAERPPPSPRRVLWTDFPRIGTDDLYAMLRLRAEVFVVEQRCAYADIDGRDPRALHLLVWLATGQAPAGCLRLFGPGADNPHATIGRVATAGFARGRGLGRWMMEEAFAEIGRRFGPVAAEVAAQVSVEPFYARLGFRRASADFDEDGIAHCLMRWRP